MGNKRRRAGFSGLLLAACCLLAALARAGIPEAEAAFQRGDFAEAARLWEQAGHTPDTLLRLAEAYQHLGRYQQVETLLDSLPPDSLDATRQAAWWQARSVLWLARGKADERGPAVFALQQALEAAETSKDPCLIGQVLNQQANLAHLDLAYPRAHQLYQTALGTCQADGETRASLLLNYWHNLRAWPEATAHDRQDAGEQARAAWQAQAPAYRQVHALLQLAGGMDSGQAAQVFAQALRIAGEMGNPTAQSQAAGAWAAWHLARGENLPALALTRQAIFFAQRDPQAARAYRWYRQLGRLLQAQGDVPAALAAYRQAASHLRQHWHSESGQGYQDVQGRFRAEIAPVYLEFVELLLRQAQQTASPALLQEALAVVESFKRIELAEYFQPPCQALGSQSCPLLEQATPAGTAILYPLVFEGHVALLLKTGQVLQVFDQTLGQAELSQEVGRLTSLLRAVPASSARVPGSAETAAGGECPALARGNAAPAANPFQDQAQLQASARRLYDWLIGPLAGALQAAGTDTLIVVPDGILRTLPFAALHDGEDYLVQRYALAVSPGLCMAAPEAPVAGPEPLLLGGLSVAAGGFSALRCVEEELKALTGLYPGRDVLENERFTQADLLLAWENKPYRALHLASHGQFSPNPADTFILTYDGKLTLDDLAGLVRQKTSQRASVDLLTLSACETAAGDDRAALGLAGVAVRAGAQSALASLWRIDDRITPLLMVEFYRQLQTPGIHKAEALRKAQRMLIEDPAYAAYQHPYYWSAFLLIGQQ